MIYQESTFRCTAKFRYRQQDTKVKVVLDEDPTYSSFDELFWCDYIGKLSYFDGKSTLVEASSIKRIWTEKNVNTYK